ncbi:MAG: MFS transporter [Pseudonocardiaceae bacterium]
MTSAATEDAATEDTAVKSANPGISRTFLDAPLATKAVLLGVFVNKLAAFIQIFLVLFLTDRGYSAGQAGLALGVYGGGAVLGVLLGGTLADRLGARTATIISMAGSAALIAALLYMPNYPTMLVTVAVISLVGQFYRPASMALLTELTPQHQLVMITAMYRLSLNLGTTAAPLFGGMLIMISYNWLFWAEALTALVYAVIAAVTLPRRKVLVGPKVLVPKAEVGTKAANHSGYRTMFADRRYLTFLLAMFLGGVVYCQYLVTLPLDLTKGGFSPWVFSVLIALNGFIVIVLELPATKFTQHWPIRRAALFGFGLVAVGYSIYALPPTVAIFVVGTIIWTLAEVLGAPTLFAYPGLVAPENVRSRYIGSMQAAFGLSYAVGPIVGVLLWSQVGRSVWLWFGAIQVVAVMLGLYGMRNLPPRAEEATAQEPLADPIQLSSADVAVAERAKAR